MNQYLFSLAWSGPVSRNKPLLAFPIEIEICLAKYTLIRSQARKGRYRGRGPVIHKLRLEGFRELRFDVLPHPKVVASPCAPPVPFQSSKEPGI